MSKYINADTLCEDLMTRWEIADKEKEKEIQSIMADIVTPIVVGQPAADVVEVVRCKDCKYVWEHENGCYECGYGFCEVREDFFCADGKRRESK